MQPQKETQLRETIAAGAGRGSGRGREGAGRAAGGGRAAAGRGGSGRVGRGTAPEADEGAEGGREGVGRADGGGRGGRGSRGGRGGRGGGRGRGRGAASEGVEEAAEGGREAQVEVVGEGEEANLLELDYDARQLAQANTYGEAREVIPQLQLSEATKAQVAEEEAQRKTTAKSVKSAAKRARSDEKAAAAAAVTAPTPTATSAEQSATTASSLVPLHLAIPIDQTDAAMVDKVLTGLRAATRQAAAAGVSVSVSDVGNNGKRRRAVTYDPTELAFERLMSDLDPLNYFKASLPCLPVAFGIQLMNHTTLDTQPLRVAFLKEFCTKMSEKYSGDSAVDYYDNLVG